VTLFYLAFQNTTDPSNTPYYWNSFRTPATPTTSLLDSTGSSHAYTLTTPWVYGTLNANGVSAVGTGDAAWVNQAVISDETWTRSTVGTNLYQLTGLDNAKRYSFQFFGSEQSAGTAWLHIVINGVTKQYNAALNSSQVLFFDDIAPASGAITWAVESKTGLGGARLCAVRIDEHVYNPYIVDSITDPVEVGGTLTYTTSGFASLTAITTNQTGITVSGITGVDGTATVAGWVDNSVYPDLPVDVTYTFTDGTNSGTIDGTVTNPASYTRLPIASPVLTSGYLAGDIFAQTGRTIVSGDIFNYTVYDDLVIDADTGYTVSSEGSFDLWVRIAAGTDAGKMFYYTVTITESGAVVVSGGGLTSSGLTSSGFTSSGLTSTGL